MHRKMWITCPAHFKSAWFSSLYRLPPMRMSGVDNLVLGGSVAAPNKNPDPQTATGVLHILTKQLRPPCERDPFRSDIHSPASVCLTSSHAIGELGLWKATQEVQMSALVGEIGWGKITLLRKLKMEMRRDHS